MEVQFDPEKRRFDQAALRFVAWADPIRPEEIENE
jgi:hypothetical protein